MMAASVSSIIHNEETGITEGYLLKESAHLKKFRKRWIVFHRKNERDWGILYSYKTHEKLEEPTEIINLDLWNKITGHSIDEKNPKRFALFSRDNTKLQQKFEEECRDFNTLPSDEEDSDQCQESKNGYTDGKKQEKVDELRKKMEKRAKRTRAFEASSAEEAKTWLTYLMKPYKQRVKTGKWESKEIETVEMRVTKGNITCEYMKKINSNDPLHCPIYYAMKEKYEWNAENLKHLNTFNHHKDEFTEKSECKYGDECKTYRRLENGHDKLYDECHMKLYRHPPRSRIINLSKNINSFTASIYKCPDTRRINRSDSLETYGGWGKGRKKINAKAENHVFYPGDGHLWLLIKEVKSNGYKNDLCLKCGKNDTCFHKEISILKIVNKKMKHAMHKKLGYPLRRDQILALILYTGIDIIYSYSYLFCLLCDLI